MEVSSVVILSTSKTLIKMLKKIISNAEIQTPLWWFSIDRNSCDPSIRQLLIQYYALLLVYCVVFWIIVSGNMKSFTLQESKYSYTTVFSNNHDLVRVSHQILWEKLIFRKLSWSDLHPFLPESHVSSLSRSVLGFVTRYSACSYSSIPICL